MIARPPGWPRRLADLIVTRLHEPFAWGTNDCASFAADAVAAVLCRDALAELRGQRANELQALRRARAIGGVPAAIDRAGFDRIAPMQAQRGDLVMIRQDDEDRPVLAVCNGEHALAPGPQGLEQAAIARGVMAWRV